MRAPRHTYGDCYIAVTARLVGDQPIRVQGVTSIASRTRREHLAVTVGRVLLYLEDRAALDALTMAVRRAGEYADEVFGPVPDAFTQAERRDRARAAKTGRPPQQ